MGLLYLLINIHHVPQEVECPTRLPLTELCRHPSQHAAHHLNLSCYKYVHIEREARLAGHSRSWTVWHTSAYAISHHLSWGVGEGHVPAPLFRALPPHHLLQPVCSGFFAASAGIYGIQIVTLANFGMSTASVPDEEVIAVGWGWGCYVTLGTCQVAWHHEGEVWVGGTPGRALAGWCARWLVHQLHGLSVCPPPTWLCRKALVLQAAISPAWFQLSGYCSHI